MKEIRFTTGTLKVTEDAINMQFLNGSVSMYRHQIGKVNIEEIKRIDKDPWVYGFRLGLGGIVLWLVGVFMAKIFIVYLGSAGMILGSIIIFGDMIFDLMLGIPVIRPLLLMTIGYECIHVVVQNTSGDNIEFETEKGHEKSALSIEKFRLDKTPIEAISVDEIEDNPLSEVEQLHSLMTKGIITEEEFNIKKKQLLKL